MCAHSTFQAIKRLTFVEVNNELLICGDFTSPAERALDTIEF